MAVAQPLLSVFGDNPEFFVFLDARRADTVVFAVALVMIPPAVLFAIEIAARLGGTRAVTPVHVTLVGLLVYLFVVQLVSSPSPGPLAVLGATVVGGGSAWLYHRYRGFRTWTRLLVVVPVVATISFLFGSPTGELFTAAAVAPVEAAEVLLVPEDEVPSIIYLVLDEFPTRTLLGADGLIDEDRFPNFAQLAETTTWYPSHSTVSSRTEHAVPAMLTSQEPRDVGPLFTDHPDNMFRLLGETHHLTVSESLTAMCPPSQCGLNPLAPPPAPSDAGPTSVELVDPAPDTDPAFDADSLYDRTVDVFFDRVVPGRDATGSQADFEETFTDVATTMATTTSTPRVPPATTDTLPDPDLDNNMTVDDFWLRVRTVPDTQPRRYNDMLDTIFAPAEPTLWFLHLVLPHFPWRFHPDGTEYGLPTGLEELGTDRTNEWVTELSRVRHGLQTEYLDTLLGEMLGRFDEAGIYDDAVLVVVADHGESFELDTAGRDFEAAVPSDVLYTPLFIKFPGQTEGERDDANVNVFDLLPTVASAAGVRIPWPVMGVDLATGAAEQRDGTKTVWRFKGEFEPRETGVFEYQQADLDAEVRRPGLPDPPAAGELPLTDLYARFGDANALVGQSFSANAASSAPVEATVVDRNRIESPPVGEVPIGVVSGMLSDDAPTDDAVVVVAVDDAIVSLSPIFTFHDVARSFLTLLPPLAIEPGGTHRIDIGWWTEAAGLVALDVG